MTTTAAKKATKKTAAAVEQAPVSTTTLIADADLPAANDSVANAETAIAAAVEASQIDADAKVGGKLISADKAFKRQGNIYRPNPLTDIAIMPGWNHRNYLAPTERAKIEEFKKSIRCFGVVRPLMGYRRQEDGKLVLTDGHTRLFAIYELFSEGYTVESVPFVFDPAKNDKERIGTMIIANSGLPFTPLNKARAIRDLIGFGDTPQSVSEDYGVPLSEVYRLLKLLETIPEAMQKLIDSEDLTVNLAEDMIKAYGAETAAKLAVEKHRVKLAEAQGTAAPAATTPAIVADDQTEMFVEVAAEAAAKAEDAHPAAKATGGRDTTVKAATKLTREDFGVQRTNVKLARSLVAMGQREIREENGRKVMVFDLETFHRLQAALGVLPTLAEDAAAETAEG